MTTFADEVRATFRRGDTDAVREMAQAEFGRARTAGDAAGEVEAVYALARVAARDGDLVEARHLASEALDAAIRSGDRRLEERPRHVLAAVTRMSGDYERARDLYLASIALNEELGQPEMVNAEYHNLAFTELHLGNLDRARALFLEGRERVFRLGYHSFLPYLGVAAAALATAEGDLVEAARMIGFTDRAYAAIGQVPDPDDAAELSDALQAVRAALGDEAFSRTYDEGAALSEADAFGLTWEA
jgi:tetratricopeptide (TPR) repeat protein